MRKTATQWLGRSIGVIAAAALFIGCYGETPSGPDRPAFSAAQIGAIATGADLANASKAPDLGSCQNLQAPAGSKVVKHVYAEGVQIYRWSGTSWTFVAPEAVLSADAQGNGQVGTHYAGPTWESNSRSKVVGAVIDRCTPNPNAIPWLSLGAVSSQGPGIFHQVTFIQRVNTVAGLAPSAPGTVIGEEARVPYTTEYYFYR
jgi:Protein of unknown function (DUF3455)